MCKRVTRAMSLFMWIPMNFHNSLNSHNINTDKKLHYKPDMNKGNESTHKNNNRNTNKESPTPGIKKHKESKTTISK